MKQAPVPREASSRGGRRKTAAKLNALATAQAARRSRVPARTRALKVPPAFKDVRDFLTSLSGLVDQFPLGTHSQIAAKLGVGNSTVVKSDPLTPQRPPTFCPSTMRRAKKQFPSRQK
jgi:hypothetical protein